MILTLLVTGLALLVFNLIVTLRRGDKNIDLSPEFKSLLDAQDRMAKSIRDEADKTRHDSELQAKNLREETGNGLERFGNSMLLRMTEIATLQKGQLESFAQQLATLTKDNNDRLEKMRVVVEQKIKDLQADNSKKLEEMRQTVDEKLHATLEKRLGESFKQVSDRLESVHKGLGEMQNLAVGVGDLKKVLTNVKTRGMWGEVQLEALLDQFLSPEQYSKNVAVKGEGNERVEVAIKLPGSEDNEVPLWLPIDSKFPQEDYQRLLEAYDKADLELVEQASKQLENRIKSEAKNIKDKYIDPPNTTDFAILFLPYESLYAEIIRRPGLCEFLQRNYRVVITCPSTLGALLTSLQMGFRTLAIQKRSSEVWNLLGAVKTEFGKFAGILEKTQIQLRRASNTIEDAAKKTRTIERKLKGVQELSPINGTALLSEAEERDLVEEATEEIAEPEEENEIPLIGDNTEYPEEQDLSF